jgi:hypothetical protein
MTFQEVEQIRNAFLSKAPDRYYLHHPTISDRQGLKHGGVSLFNGSTDHSEKVASFSVKAVDGQRMSVTLIIEWNSYEFMEEHELCIELIERFVPSFREQLANHSSNKILS